MPFSKLGLSTPIVKAVTEQGYTSPTPIQAKTIPVILSQRNLIAAAQTGTGKTASFVLPILEMLSNSETQRKKRIRALILTPTRELAVQVEDNISQYGKYLNLTSMAMYGGVDSKPQRERLIEGVDILVATPGRLLDMYTQRAIHFDELEILVLDEADRMLDMGFLRDIKKIISFLPQKRQNLLFSATFSKEIKKLAQGILHNPVMVEAAPENTTAEKVNQKLYKVPKSKKTELVGQLISKGNWSQVLIFTRTKHGANRLTEKLIKRGISAAAIHGNKSQGARTKALKGFKDNSIRVLVATDIAARGLDIPLLPHVINFELPNVPEDYVHRIGRTGRAGASGEAISLVSQEEEAYLKSIEKLLGQKIIVSQLEGFDLSTIKDEIKTERPKQQPRNKPAKKPFKASSDPKKKTKKASAENSKKHTPRKRNNRNRRNNNKTPQ